MMKRVLASLLLSASFAAVPAYAQDNPNTTQTDQSEEDWRKSKKKTTPDDPWNGFKNTNGWGQGTQRSMSPVDRLPEESRRFLMKERAERLAEAGVGEPVDTSFEPSEAAKSDPTLESDEKDAWSDMMKDMGAPNGGMPGDPNADPTQGGAPQIPTQVGQLGQKDVGKAGSGSPTGAQGGSSSPSSVMRGGSNASVSDILAQIKGGGRGPQGQTGQGQAQAQAAQGQAPTAAQMKAQGQQQAQSQNQAQGQAQDQSQAQADAQSAAQAASDAAAQSQSQAQAQGQAQSQAQADAAKAAQASTRTPEAISPLDRLKQTQDERAATGSRSSASDYLNRGN